VVWPGKLLADSNFFIFFIYFNKIYIKILCYNNHAHTSLNQSSDTNISQGSVATHLRVGRIFHNHSAINLLLNLWVKEF